MEVYMTKKETKKKHNELKKRSGIAEVESNEIPYNQKEAYELKKTGPTEFTKFVKKHQK